VDIGKPQAGQVAKHGSIAIVRIVNGKVMFGKIVLAKFIEEDNNVPVGFCRRLAMIIRIGEKRKG